MKNLVIRLIKNKKELEEVFNIRNIVFGKEQKISRDLDFDEFDNKSEHIIVFYQDKVIGTMRLLFDKDKVRFGRLAVIKEYRNKGIGKEIMTYSINYCKRKNINEIYFHSQYYVKEFYEKFGFKIRGKLFNEAGIKHIEMYMKLK